jgi:hypothetical protein
MSIYFKGLRAFGGKGVFGEKLLLSLFNGRSGRLFIVATSIAETP